MHTDTCIKYFCAHTSVERECGDIEQHIKLLLEGLKKYPAFDKMWMMLIQVCMYVRMFVCLCGDTCMYVCMYVCLYYVKISQTHTHTHVHAHGKCITSACTALFACIYVYVYMNTYSHTHVYRRIAEKRIWTKHGKHTQKGHQSVLIQSTSGLLQLVLKWSLDRCHTC